MVPVWCRHREASAASTVKPQFGRQQTIKAYAGLEWNREINLGLGPVGRFVLDLFLDIKLGKLVDALRFASQGFEVECFRSYPLRIVRLQRFHNGRADVADILPLENRPVPAFVADQAFIDEPGIQFAAVGIKPDLAAGLKRPQVATSAACKPGLGRRSWCNGPLDPKYIAHIVLVFHLEVHQDGAGENPDGNGVAMFRVGEELRQQSCAGHILTMPDRSLATTR